MKRAYLLLSLVLVSIFFTACMNNTVDKPVSAKQKAENIFDANIRHITDQLLQNNRLDPKIDTLSITTFIDLDQSAQSTSLGRKLSNGIYNELLKRGYNIKDVRETKTFVMKPNGELLLSGIPKVLNKKRVENSYILVATYSNIDGGTLINARILDHVNGEVISVARSLVNINQYQMMSNHMQIAAPQPMKVQYVESSTKTTDTKKRTIKLSNADCKDETCKKDANNIKNISKAEVSKTENSDELSKIDTMENKKICDYR